LIALQHVFILRRKHCHRFYWLARSQIVRIDVIQDAGKSMNPDVDIGQVEGALVMGLGLWTLEKLQYDEETGELLTRNTWEYKPPLPKDIPKDLRVTLLEKSVNREQVHGSKATGEPPLC